ncbi:MAG: 5-(carboxyamino)imidazole ribonucleotide synthase, partial [Isosphaeraceae bacterium]
MSLSTFLAPATRNEAIFPPAPLGVIGSGQLGRMFILAAQRLGYRPGVLSATSETPAAQVAHWTVIGLP